MTPLRAIRLQCFFCMNDHAPGIAECTDKVCVFYNFRMMKNNSNPRKSALKQIRKYCLDCGDGWKGVKDCEYKDCALYKFRFGKNPNRKGTVGNPNLHSMKKQAH